ncbi:hypothetical protein [Streptomyces sp. C10-9-1]|uniref:hypothetical protein n=1 Tax=Streptomyces sp. C10-9-1 TaxID=1859285 RepID=UPI003D7578F1
MDTPYGGFDDGPAAPGGLLPGPEARERPAGAVLTEPGAPDDRTTTPARGGVAVAAKASGLPVVLPRTDADGG